jgi:hypothetical protein
MSSTKLIVLKSRELIYTALLILLVIVFVVIFFIMFKAKEATDESKTSADTSSPVAVMSSGASIKYNPGTYLTHLTLSDYSVPISVQVDEYSIIGISVDNVDSALNDMYPLLSSSVEDINTQLHYVDSPDDVSFSAENNYTARLIMDCVKEALKEAVIN